MIQSRSQEAGVFLKTIAGVAILFAFALTSEAQDYSGGLRALRTRLPEDEIIYLLLPDRFDNANPDNDRGGLTGDRSKTGFDPTDKAYYHGGDLQGVIRRLDYIKALGATAIWLTPVFANKAVQGPPGKESAGYHGYWPLNFTDIDRHLGNREDYRALVEAAHSRGMKVYLDIVINHTADIIQYRECPMTACAYRDHGNYPYTRKGGLSGERINDGFIGDEKAGQTESNFARLTRPDYAYTPYVPQGEEHAKIPDWLNNPIYYHNRGESTFRGESSQFGDFFGLDDLFTEHPRVLSGMIEIYGHWIDEYGVDGFRIDTARHVNPEFWQAFVPAMLERAKADGIPNFHIFGEVMETTPGLLAQHTRVDGLPAVNDFALRAALVDAIAGEGPADRISDVFQGDDLYEHRENTARQLVTLTGNHDVLRFAHAVRHARPNASADEVLRRVELGYAVIMSARGIPAIYYGDEQGFTGQSKDDLDQYSREDMFATQVNSYRTEERLGASNSSGGAFDEQHPLFRSIARLAHVRQQEPALRRGRQVTRASGDSSGVLAFSKISDGGEEIVAVFNTSLKPVTDHIPVETRSMRWTSLIGQCAEESSAPGSYAVHLEPLGYALCKAKQ